MPETKDIDETTELLRQSVIASKSKKFCVKDFSGDVFELTSDMLVKDRKFDKKTAGKMSEIAECILQKYAKLLSLSK